MTVGINPASDVMNDAVDLRAGGMTLQEAARVVAHEGGAIADLDDFLQRNAGHFDAPHWRFAGSWGPVLEDWYGGMERKILIPMYWRLLNGIWIGFGRPDNHREDIRRIDHRSWQWLSSGDLIRSAVASGVMDDKTVFVDVRIFSADEPANRVATPMSAVYNAAGEGAEAEDDSEDAPMEAAIKAAFPEGMPFGIKARARNAMIRSAADRLGIDIGNKEASKKQIDRTLKSRPAVAGDLSTAK